MSSAMIQLIQKAHTIYSTHIMSVEDFTGDNPMFEGEWEIEWQNSVKWVFYSPSLNIYLHVERKSNLHTFTEQTKGLGLVWNDKYELK